MRTRTQRHVSPSPLRLIVWIGIGLVAATVHIRAEANVVSTLETFGYDSSHDGVARCLTDMVWTPERETQFEQALARLDSDDFATRDLGTATLMKMSALPHNRLQGISGQPDLSTESRRRIYQVLNFNTPLRRELILYLAANAIRLENHQGLARELVDAANCIPVTQRSVWDAARAAMLATVLPADTDTLASAVSMPEPTARALACEGLNAIEGANSRDSLRPLLADPDPRVRFHAAQAFLRTRSPECVPAFISLLDTTLPAQYQKHDTHIRFYSVNILKKLTGQKFGYRAALPPERRKPFIEQWNTWFRENGATTVLKFEISQNS